MPFQTVWRQRYCQQCYRGTVRVKTASKEQPSCTVKDGLAFLQETNQHKLIIHLRLLKIINDTASLNNSSVVSNVYTPTIPHLNTYAASRHSGIPIHHVPTISIIIMILVLPPLLIMPPPSIIFSTLTGAYKANTISSIFPSSFTLSSTRYNPVYTPAKIVLAYKTKSKI